MNPSERRDMIRKENTNLSLTRQCKLLKISRSSIYYTPFGFDQAAIDLMHEINRIFTKYPFFGSHQIAAYLLQSGLAAERHRVRRLMGIMGCRPSIKDRTPARSIRSIRSGHINRERCQSRAPITFGAAKLPAFQCRTGSYIWSQSWIGRRAKCCPGGFQIGWTPAFTLKNWKKAIAKYSKPEIMNTDQGSKYTCADWITTLTKAEIKTSMDGRGRYQDNIFIERL